MAEGIALVYLAVVVFALVLAVCWIIRPFALIGTKPLLRQILVEPRKTNALLEQRLPDLGNRHLKP
jgi:hypothetical protein